MGLSRSRSRSLSRVPVPSIRLAGRDNAVRDGGRIPLGVDTASGREEEGPVPDLLGTRLCETCDVRLGVRVELPNANRLGGLVEVALALALAPARSTPPVPSPSIMDLARPDETGGLSSCFSCLSFSLARNDADWAAIFIKGDGMVGRCGSSLPLRRDDAPDGAR